MLHSDPEPKATSVPRFKHGDKVRLKCDPPGALAGELIHFHQNENVVRVLWQNGKTHDYLLSTLELVPDVTAPAEPDVAPSPFKLGDRDREPVKLLDVPYAPDKEKWRAAANNVDHPSHYTAGGIETITAIEAMVGQKGWSPLTGYRLGNVLKYLWRHAAKGGVESLKKARWYLDREIEAQEAAVPPKVTP